MLTFDPTGKGSIDTGQCIVVAVIVCHRHDNLPIQLSLLVFHRRCMLSLRSVERKKLILPEPCCTIAICLSCKCHSIYLDRLVLLYNRSKLQVPFYIPGPLSIVVQ